MKQEKQTQQLQSAVRKAYPSDCAMPNGGAKLDENIANISDAGVGCPAACYAVMRAVGQAGGRPQSNTDAAAEAVRVADQGMTHADGVVMGSGKVGFNDLGRDARDATASFMAHPAHPAHPAHRALGIGYGIERHPRPGMWRACS